MAADGDPLPTVGEAEATGRIAEIFDDLRRTLGVPVVNLVWRRIAVRPDRLEWAWSTVRPLYAGGLVAAEADALRAGLDLPPVPAMDATVLEAAGIDSAARPALLGVLDSYDRSNAMNLVGLSALLAILDGEGDRGAASPAPASAGSPRAGVEGALPTLLPLDAMTPATAGLVRRLNRIGESGDPDLIVSIWRHLAHWPPYLALAWCLLAPLDQPSTDDGGSSPLRRAIEAVRGEGRRRGGRLAAALGAPSSPDADTRAEVREVLDLFTRHPIAKMTAICRILRSVTPAA